ncbi:hypothetical protein ADL15_34235 [Actinoplanes awajinensis subsp. mycoplanecinus]|uniref:Uncharacterized protein n=2 Tax=Actinoplanes awajinensis TaxID=135946 RepID=A0A101JJ80_9ACTN|nr:hypothetical protein ADL15_34235 [Actinoplanes awajinensis subsp. mycoplanecinus]
MTTTMKFQDLPEVVGLSSQDQMTGVVLCGTLAEIDKEDLLQNAGALSRETMRRVDAALAFTFGLSVGT